MSHRLGLNTIKKTGESPITGDVELTAGSNVTLTQSGNAITIAATGGGEGGGSNWGNIGGTLSDQTDLQSALDDKADDDSVMHLTGDEEISGNKTFLDDIYADNVYATLLGLFTKYATFDTTETESIGFGFKSNNVLKAALSLYTGNNDFFVDIYDDEGTKVTATTWNGEAGLMTLFPNNPELGVAIGKTSATELLDVNGNIAVSGTVDGVDLSTLSEVATSGDYSDLINTPNLGTAAAAATTDFATAAQGNLADSAVQDLSDLGITASASELNLLDGVTTSTAELNHVDGVTSAIQTQLNDKPSLTNANTFTAGSKQTVTHSGTTAGFSLGNSAGNPSSTAEGDLWYNSSNDSLLYRAGASARTVVTTDASQTLTGKTIDANGTGNSITNLEVADFASGVVDTDLSSVSGSDDTLASAKAIKAALDGKVAASTISASGKGFVAHGSTAGTARPTGYASVEWIGSVEPTNAVDGDTWIQT